MSQVTVNANVVAYASTHVATGMLRGLKQIITGAGLSPAKLSKEWILLEDGISTWLASRHLQRVSLEVWDPAAPTVLIQRFDFAIDYSYYSDADGQLWLDPQVVRQAILKAGAVPSRCDYVVKMDNAPGRPYVAGFEDCEYLSTNGMRERSVGTAVGGGALGAALSYWARS